MQLSLWKRIFASLTTSTSAHCVQLSVKLLRSRERILFTSTRFSFPRVLRCPTGIDHRCYSFQDVAAILDCVTHLASMSCWYRLDARQDEFRLSQAAIL